MIAMKADHYRLGLREAVTAEELEGAPRGDGAILCRGYGGGYVKLYTGWHFIEPYMLPSPAKKKKYT